MSYWHLAFLCICCIDCSDVRLFTFHVYDSNDSALCNMQHHLAVIEYVLIVLPAFVQLLEMKQFLHVIF